MVTVSDDRLISAYIDALKEEGFKPGINKGAIAKYFKGNQSIYITGYYVTVHEDGKYKRQDHIRDLIAFDTGE